RSGAATGSGPLQSELLCEAREEVVNLLLGPPLALNRASDARQLLVEILFTRPGLVSPPSDRPHLATLGELPWLHMAGGSLGVGERGVIILSPLCDEPAEEVVEPIIRTAAVHDPGHGPQVPPERIPHALLEAAVELDDLFRPKHLESVQ